MSLEAARRAIRPLLDQTTAADATAVYYAFYHDARRTQIFPHPPGAAYARGYLTLSRTGIDLFRPLLTLRLPAALAEAADMLNATLRPGQSFFVHAPASYRPVLAALCAVEQEHALQLWRLDEQRFRRELNVLVTRTTTPDGLPRFIVRPTQGDERGDVAAAATLNWQSPRFADIAVFTEPQSRGRGWGQSVVAALAQEVLASGRTPLYHLEPHNEASRRLAQRLGFVNTGADRLFMELTLQAPR